MPTAFGEIVTAVTDFITTYAVFITAGIILAFAIGGLKKLMGRGR